MGVIVTIDHVRAHWPNNIVSQLVDHLSDEEDDEVSPANMAIEEAIETAEQVVLGTFRNRVASDADIVINALAKSLTFELVFIHLSKARPETVNMEEINQRATMAQSTLDRISRGAIAIGVSPDRTPLTGGPIVSLRGTTDSPFDFQF